MLISDRHRKLYRDYFAARQRENKNPMRPHKWQAEFEKIAEQAKAVTILDYGCGPNACLSAFSKRNIANYDPAIPGIATKPEGVFDLVVCNHVLEHVEPDCLDDVLTDIWVSGRAALVAVSLQGSSKKLSDGTDWHCIVQDREWWLSKFAGVFGDGFTVVNLGDPEAELAIFWRA